MVSDSSHLNINYKVHNTYSLYIWLKQFYILPEKHVTKDYMKAIIAGRKHLLGKQEVKHVELRKFDEVSVKAMYPKLLEHDELKPYFPDSYPKGR